MEVVGSDDRRHAFVGSGHLRLPERPEGAAGPLDEAHAAGDVAVVHLDGCAAARRTSPVSDSLRRLVGAQYGSCYLDSTG
jgi:hypothetical protein